MRFQPNTPRTGNQSITIQVEAIHVTAAFREVKCEIKTSLRETTSPTVLLSRSSLLRYAYVKSVLKKSESSESSQKNTLGSTRCLKYFISFIV